MNEIEHSDNWFTHEMVQIKLITKYSFILPFQYPRATLPPQKVDADLALYLQ